jgi:hypothetical protein
MILAESGACCKAILILHNVYVLWKIPYSTCIMWTTSAFLLKSFQEPDIDENQQRGASSL